MAPSYYEGHEQGRVKVKLPAEERRTAVMVMTHPVLVKSFLEEAPIVRTLIKGLQREALFGVWDGIVRRQVEGGG